MGGAQPLAAVFAGACCLAVECDETRIDFRIRTRYLDAKATDLDEALAMIDALDRRRRGEVGRPRRQRGRRLPGAGPPRRAARHRHRPDQRPRPGQRLPAGWLDGRRMAGEAGDRPQGGGAGGAVEHEDPGRRDGRVAPHGRAGARLRQQHPPDGAGGGTARGLRLPRLRARLHPAAVLPRDRAVPLVRAVGRSRGHPSHRPTREGADAGRRASAPVARHGGRTDRLPGLAGADLLGRPRRPRTGWGSRSTKWSRRAS